MSNVHELPWSGQPLDPIPLERSTDATWFAQSIFLREIDQGAHEDVAREVAINRLRWRHSAEMRAAEAALDAVRGAADAA